MSTLVQSLTDTLGAAAVLSGERARAFSVGSPHPSACAALAVVRPKSTQETSQIMALCHARRTPVVPIGGGSGLVEGAAVAAGQILMSFDRMSAIECIDLDQQCAIVQSGVRLQTLQEKAAEQRLMFPLDIGARGSATIGGLVSTNGGGNRVLRFGMMRDQILGLEAVLADGQVVDSMNLMLKNNAGYDLKQLFIGSEGTLGVVTRAALRLRPAQACTQTALVQLPCFAALLSLLRIMSTRHANSLSAFEAMWPEFYLAAAGATPPLAHGAALYVLIETMGAEAEAARDQIEHSLSDALDAGVVIDAVLAQNQREALMLWSIRDNVNALNAGGPCLMFDVSMPIGRMEQYILDVRSAMQQIWPTGDIYTWGHVADGNLHIWASLGPIDAAMRARAEAIVYGALAPFRGSISGEHGIGLEKRDHLEISRSSQEIALMKAIKTTLDPHGLLNPGKVLTATQTDLRG